MSEGLPDPGSPEAVARGCLCDMCDEEAADNDRWPNFKVRGCPIHGPLARGAGARDPKVSSDVRP